MSGAYQHRHHHRSRWPRIKPPRLTKFYIPANYSARTNKQENSFLDNNDTERERKYYHLAKNVAVNYKGTNQHHWYPRPPPILAEKWNAWWIWPMVLSACRCFEGPDACKPVRDPESHQRRKKAVLVINKVDKTKLPPRQEVHDGVFDLFFNLWASEEQLDFPPCTAQTNKAGWGPTGKIPPAILPTCLDTILANVPEAPKEKAPFSYKILRSTIPRISVVSPHWTRSTVQQLRKICL